MLIYKITNLINNKVYIGLTTHSLEYRWSRHKTEGRNKNNNKHLYRSIRKYGEENFSIEKIDESSDLSILGELERHYIDLYKSRNPDWGYNLTAGGERNQWDANPSAKLSYNDVVLIREIYAMKELELSDCWELFKNKISYSAFQKVWLGYTWKGIMDEVYTEETKYYYSHTAKARPGEENVLSYYTNKEILTIREYYVNHTLKETFKKYGKGTISGMRQAISRSYSNIPIYNKIKKVWTLNNKIIDLKEFKLNYNPVSTILESEE